MIPLPAFNIKGDEKVSTIPGGFITIVLYVIVLLYGLLRFLHLATKHNPNISTYYSEDGMSNGNVLNLNERGFRIAVSMESYLGKKQLNDPKYVKYIFRLTGYKGGKSY